MAVANYAGYKSAIENPTQAVHFNSVLSAVASRPMDMFTQMVPAPVAPTASVVPTSATTGALPFVNAAVPALGMVGARASAAIPGCYMLYDRLVHQAGLSATVTTAQTTNLPTAALTRYTDGAGVMLGLTIWTVIGTTGTTVTATYTNQDGTGSRVTKAVAFGATSFREAGRMILLPLQEGDTGVRSVQSVTVLASTVTAGNFGVTLFKPLAAIIVPEMGQNAVIDLVSGNMGGGLPEIVDSACLSFVAMSSAAVGHVTGTLLLTEW